MRRRLIDAELPPVGSEAFAREVMYLWHAVTEWRARGADLNADASAFFKEFFAPTLRELVAAAVEMDSGVALLVQFDRWIEETMRDFGLKLALAKRLGGSRPPYVVRERGAKGRPLRIAKSTKATRRKKKARPPAYRNLAATAYVDGLLAAPLPKHAWPLVKPLEDAGYGRPIPPDVLKALSRPRSLKFAPRVGTAPNFDPEPEHRWYDADGRPAPDDEV